MPAAIVVGLVLAAVVLGLLLRDGDGGSEEVVAPAPTATVTATATVEPAGTIAYDEGRAVQLDSTRAQVEELLGPSGAQPAALPAAVAGRDCVYYAIRGERRYYQFCFDDSGRLAQAVAVPAPVP